MYDHVRPYIKWILFYRIHPLTAISIRNALIHQNKMIVLRDTPTISASWLCDNFNSALVSFRRFFKISLSSKTHHLLNQCPMKNRIVDTTKFSFYAFLKICSLSIKSPPVSCTKFYLQPNNSTAKFSCQHFLTSFLCIRYNR